MVWFLVLFLGRIIYSEQKILAWDCVLYPDGVVSINASMVSILFSDLLAALSASCNDYQLCCDGFVIAGSNHHNLSRNELCPGNG